MPVSRARLQLLRHHAARAGMAIGLTAVGLGLVLGLGSIFNRPFPAILIVSVILSARLAGLSGGVIASLLSALAIDYFLQPPLLQLGIASPADGVQLLMFILAGLTVSYLARTRKAVQAELDEHVQALEVMRERERIAMDIHDGIIQSLYATVVKIAAVRRQLPSEDHVAWDTLQAASKTISAEIEGLRTYIAALRTTSARLPALRAELEGLVAQFPEQELPRACVHVSDQVPSAIDASSLADVLYIAREAVSNARRHAHAGQVDVSLTRAGQWIVLTVRDDGRGFDPDVATAPGHGLWNMRERSSHIGARLTVRSQPDRGTIIRVRLPAKDDSLSAEVA